MKTWSLKRLKKQIKWFYFQYELITGVYIFEPWEAFVVNGLFILCLISLIYWACAFAKFINLDSFHNN